MADRYQDKPFSADDDYDRGGDPHAPARSESDPLAELARLIGQTDPFAMGRANQRARPAPEPDPYDAPEALEDRAPAGPPPWMQRGVVPEPERPGYPSAVHPLRRYAMPLAAPEPEYQEAPYADAGQEADPSRYDEALYGQLETGEEQAGHDPAYADDAYAYQDGYEEEADEPVRKRGGLVTVAAVVALAFIGTGGAFAYRTYVGSPRSGEPPIIRADAGPTKIVTAPADGASKVPDRMTPGDGAEKIVPREEAPVDVNAKSGPRVVLPQLNPNPNPPPLASVATAAPPPAGTGNGTLPNNEPRKIKTQAIRGEAPDAAAMPVTSVPPPAAGAAKPATTVRTPVAPRNPPTSANASANAPLSLAPQAGPQSAPAAPARVATIAPAPVAAPSAPATVGGGYLVQVSSQKNEADAQASYRSLQSKFPTVLGSHSPVIKRADLGDKGVYYRAMVGPFGSPDEASQFCGNLKTAGGQCVVQKN